MADYYLIVKTADAEMKALENTDPSVMDCFIPVIELTRGRKLPLKEKDPGKRRLEKPRYPYEKRLERISDIFRDRDVIFDLTSDDTLSSDEIKELFIPDNGYKNWLNLLQRLNASGNFRSITPCIIIDAEDEHLDDNMATEVNSLTKMFDAVAYRNDIFDDNCYDDIEIIKDNLNDKRLIVIVDCSFVVQASIADYVKKVKARVTNLRKVVPLGTTIVVSATSFPRNISDIGKDDYDEFKLSEVVLSDELKNNGVSVEYSDYGSINPIRNDTIVMAHGWVPRIDVALKESVFYYRERRADKNQEYCVVYKKVAGKVLADAKFPFDMDTNWGIRQIRSAANGGKPGSSPSFWISVRMSIHIEQQVRRLAGR